MCIIAIKKVGVEMPSEAIIKNMFQRNPDGAGIMWFDKDINQVRIEKGIMDIKTFLSKVKRFRSNDLLVMHFRIGTSGGNIKANTHPFMISENFEDLKKLKACTDIGVVHNGIIDITRSRKDVSDTMEFIANRLSCIKNAMPEFYKDKDILKWVENEIDSKMCFLTGKGEIVTVGFFNEKNGVMYSNYTYEDSKSIYKPYKYDLYNWDDYDWSKYDKPISGSSNKDLKTPDDIKNALIKLEDDLELNRYAPLFKIPNELVVMDESTGVFYESNEFVIDNCMNVYEIIGYNEMLECDEVIYDQMLSIVTYQNDYVENINYSDLEEAFYYEIFM